MRIQLSFISLSLELLGSTIGLSLPKIFCDPQQFLGSVYSHAVCTDLAHCLINSPANLTLVGFRESCYEGCEFCKMSMNFHMVEDYQQYFIHKYIYLASFPGSPHA